MKKLSFTKKINKINNPIIAVNTEARLDCFKAVTGGSSPICKILFFRTDLPVFALTGVTWLVVALNIVFIIMGML